MNQNTFLKITVILLIILNAGMLGYMWMRPRNSHRPPELGNYLMHELNFTHDQRNKFEKLRDEHRALAGPWRRQNRELHDAFYDLVVTAPDDSAKVMMYADSIAAVQKRIELSMFYHFKDVEQLCTPEQKQKLREVIHGAVRVMMPPPPPDRR